MAVFTLARFEVRPDACEQAERAMHDFATYVRRELDDSMWTVYRETDVPRYVALIRADDAAAVARHHGAPGTTAFVEALSPLLVGTVERAEYALVTSSDLAPRPRRLAQSTARRGRRGR